VKCWHRISTLDRKWEAFFQQVSGHVHLWKAVCDKLLSAFSRTWRQWPNFTMSSHPSIQNLKCHCSPRAVMQTASRKLHFYHRSSQEPKCEWLMGADRLILNFWNNVNIAVSEIMRSTLMLSPDICLFQSINELTYKAHLRKFLHLPMLADRRDTKLLEAWQTLQLSKVSLQMFSV